MEPGGRTSESATFAQALASLKRRGSSLLLVGPAYEQAHLPASRRLLGSAEERTERARLLVVTDGEATAGRRLAGVASETVRTLTYDAPTRGGAATAVGTDDAGVGAGRPGTEAPPPDLASLCRRIDEAVDEVEAERGNLEPAELRVCFDSLVPLLERYEEREVFTFLHALTAATREVGAMAHYHLPVPADDPLVGTLAPLFDAVIELRATPDGPQQRWRLTDEDVVTEWLPV
jgi:hypothetical protein